MIVDAAVFRLHRLLSEFSVTSLNQSGTKLHHAHNLIKQTIERFTPPVNEPTRAASSPCRTGCEGGCCCSISASIAIVDSHPLRRMGLLSESAEDKRKPTKHGEVSFKRRRYNEKHSTAKIEFRSPVSVTKTPTAIAVHPKPPGKIYTRASCGVVRRTMGSRSAVP